MKPACWCALLAFPTLADAQTQLTIYNQDFAAVKEQRVLNLKSGTNEVRLSGVTAQLEPDSVVLRDLDPPDGIRIPEQNYESEPLSEGMLLLKSEGKTIGFEIPQPNGQKSVVRGLVLRSGYAPRVTPMQTYATRYGVNPAFYNDPFAGAGGQPIIEVDGKISFVLPGRPIFDSLDPASFLKPTLLWRLEAARAGAHRAEISYLTGGMRWEATYNVVAPEKGDLFDLTGWVTLENMSGKDFPDASIKLMAGDVARAPAQTAGRIVLSTDTGMDTGGYYTPPVSEKPFDEYHLYTVARPTTLLNRETKQVEFVRASSVPANRLYIYDGATFANGYGLANAVVYRTQPEYGITSNPKVWVLLEFKNSDSSHLGMPLPAGAVKIYRRDTDGRNEFIGEARIDHTPKDETRRLRLGDAFDLTGQRTQTRFVQHPHGADEAFEIHVRNHKAEPVEVRVVEHLYRWSNWTITEKSLDYAKTDARTIEFRPNLAANGEAVISYTVHYDWP